MVDILCARRWEKRNRTDFYRVILITSNLMVYNLMVLETFDTWNLCEYQVILTLNIVQKSLQLVQISFFSLFLGHLSQNIYLKIFKTT